MVKVAAAIVAGVLVTGAAYQGVTSLLDRPSKQVAAAPDGAVKGAFASGNESRAQRGGTQPAGSVSATGCRRIDVRSDL